MAFQLMTKTLKIMTKNSPKKNQHSRYFSQTGAGNGIATFHPGHNTALKNLS